MPLGGAFWVRVAVAAIHDAKNLWPKTKDRMIARRHSLKLRHWPRGDEGGQVLDMDWCWIKALRALDIGELRVRDVIGGHDNVRLIFYVSDKIKDSDPMRIIWILAAIQKKRDDFTKGELANFKARRQNIRTRYYEL